jgi:serine protease Do
MNKKSFLLSVFGSALLGSGIALSAYHFWLKDGVMGDYVHNENPPHYRNVSNHVVPGNFDFTYAAEVSTPTVVHITTYQKVTQRNYGYYNDPFQDDFFRQFFGDGFPGQQRQQPKSDQKEPETTEQKAGSGSGVILSADGYIVTNNHVVKGADKIEVVLNDKRRYKAELIGVDPTTDLAVLKIEEKNLSYVKYGNSDKIRVGEWVVAVGNPFDLTSTVTAGIVSAKARNINILKDKENMAIESFIQTDAAVNPGNSGGALVNLQGELIGINTAIATPTGTFAGYSFAVPSTLVQKVVEDLIKFGEVQRALLGVNITEITAELKEEKKLDKLEGVYVAGVREGSSAGEAGLKEGDVILKVNEVSVNSSSELQEAVALYRPGDKVNITYKRNGKIAIQAVTLKNKMGNTDVVKKEDRAKILLFNSEIREINDEEREALGIEEGIKVLSVGEGKLKGIGIKPGFVITKVDKKAVGDPTDLVNYLSNHDGALLIEGMYSKSQRAYYTIGY